MSGIWFGGVKAIHCSKAVIDGCRELAHCSQNARRMVRA